MPTLRPKRGHPGILRPTRRQVPVMTRQGRSRVKKPRVALGRQGRDRIVGQLTGKTNLRLCIQRRLGGIGDVLMTTPVVKALKTRYPEAELTYATDPQYYNGDLLRILEGNPYIDKLVDFRGVNQNDYHLFVDLTGICPPYETKSNPPVNRIDLFARHVGIRLDDPLPDYMITSEDRGWATTIIKKWFGEGSYKVVVIHTASVDRRRTWPVKNYIQMLHELTEERPELRFIVLDQNRQKEHWDTKNCVNASNYGIRQAASLIWAGDVFVGPDSGPLHLAGAMEKEIVAIFGSTDSTARINYYDGAISVDSDLPCSPCWYATCPQNLACMRQIPITQVKEAIIQKVDQKIPVAFSDTYRIKLVTDPSCSLEEHCMAKALQAGLSQSGINTVLNPTDITSKDLVIDILKTSAIDQPLHGKSPTALLNLCIPVISEDKLSRSAVQRLASNYDGLLCFGADAIKTVREAGVATIINSLSYPVVSQPRSKPKTDHLVSFVHQIIPENLTTLLQAINQYENKFKTQLFLTINTSDEHSIQTAHNVIGKHSRIKVRFINDISLYNSLWEDAAVFIDLNGFSQGWFATDAIARGLAVLAGDYSSLSPLPDSLLYKIPIVGAKPLLNTGDGKYLGHYYTHNVQDILDGLTTIFTLYHHDRREKMERLKYVLELANKKSFGRIVSILQRRIKL